LQDCLYRLPVTMHNTGVQILVVRKQPDNDESDPIKRKYNNNCENSECNTSCDMHPDET